jgi:hypothetical protein
MDRLEGSCSQNTLKNKRLEHLSYRQERNFIDREKLRRDTQQDLETGCPLSVGELSFYICKSCMKKRMWCGPRGPFLRCTGLSVFPDFSHLGWFLHFSHAVGASHS